MLAKKRLARVTISVDKDDYAALGPAARAHVVERYDFLTRTRAQHLARMNSLVPRAKAIRI